MAASRVSNLIRSFNRISLSINTINHNYCNTQCFLLQSFQNPALISARSLNFFDKLPSEDLWKSVTSVSNAGRKKGRGRGAAKRFAKDLNRGQVIGVGKVNMLWPGLNAPVLRGRELVKQQQLPEDPDRMAKIIKMRDSQTKFRFLKLNPLERGWSGTKMPGRRIGPPDPIRDETFPGFDSIVLEFKPLLIMRGALGRVRKISAMVVTGNSKGLAGFAVGKARDGNTALRKARNRAAQKLMYFDIYNNHSVYHDFFTQFGSTKIFVYKKPEGYGLVCHRAIKEICKIVGIKDLHAKVEGSLNLQNIVKAFFIGLLKMKSHQDLAEEKQLHLIEFKKENGNFPTVVASPTVVRTKEEIKKDEVMDFTRYVLDNRIILKRKKILPFYVKLQSWGYKIKSIEKTREHDRIKLEMLTERGELGSFLTDRYPDKPEDKSE